MQQRPSAGGRLDGELPTCNQGDKETHGGVPVLITAVPGILGANTWPCSLLLLHPSLRPACELVAHQPTPQCRRISKHRRHSSSRWRLTSYAQIAHGTFHRASGLVDCPAPAMATQHQGGLPVSIAHQQQHFRLLELPPEIVELIDKPNPPLYVCRRVALDADSLFSPRVPDCPSNRKLLPLLLARITQSPHMLYSAPRTSRSRCARSRRPTRSS